MPVLTVNVPELAGIPWGTPGSRIIGWVETSADAIVDSAAGTVSLGRPPLDFDANGLATITLPATIGTYKYRVVLDHSDGGKKVTWSSGYFNLTADANLASLTTTTVLNTYPTLADAISAKNSAAASAAAAAASAQTAHDISNIDTSDDVVTALVNDQGSAFHDALAAGYAGKNNVSIDINRGPYNAQPGTDITTALQQAVNDLAATGLSGEIVFTKGGTYYLNGAQQTGTVLGYTYSGQILLPAVGDLGSMALRFRGASPINDGGSGRITSGTTLISNATSGWIFDCIPAFTKFGAVYPWTNLTPSFEDIIIQAPSNPQCGGINARTCSSFRFLRSGMSTGTVGSNETFTGTKEAISMPQLLNAGSLTIRDSMVRNWPKGIRLTEHGVLSQVRLANCGSALVSTGSTHANHFTQVDVENCLNIIEYDAASVGNPLIVYGDLDWESGITKVNALVKHPGVRSVQGKLDIRAVGNAGFPLVSTATGNASRINALGLSSIQNGGRSCLDTHPFDTFARVGSPLTQGPGTAWPSMHPWWVNLGSFSLTSDGTTGSLVSTNGTSQSLALVAAKDAGVSRTVTATVTLGATHHVRLIANQMLGGPGINRFLAVDCIASGAVKLIAYLDGTNGQVYATSTTNILDGETHTIGLTIINDDLGIPQTARVYIDGAQTATYTLTAAQKALLVPDVNVLADAPWVADGVALFETASKVTQFRVTGAGS